jgi:hypothetical protein
MSRDLTNTQGMAADVDSFVRPRFESMAYSTRYYAWLSTRQAVEALPEASPEEIAMHASALAIVEFTGERDRYLAGHTMHLNNTTPENMQEFEQYVEVTGPRWAAHIAGITQGARTQ